ncbi:MAG: MFS transporter [Oceanipulchritudo sp.]
MRKDSRIGKGADKRALWSWSLYDWAGQSYATVIQTFVFAAHFTNRIADDPEQATRDWSLTIGFTSFCVGLCGPVLGAIVDRTGRHKPYVAGFTCFCALCTAGLWFIRPDSSAYTTALGLLALATSGTQMAIIFYNAMLADLAPREEYGKWSGRGWALGYAGGIACLAAVLFFFVHDAALFELDREKAIHVRVSFPFVAAWLIVFMLPLLLFTPDRKPTGIPKKEAFRKGLRQLRNSFAEVRRFPGMLRFLIARAIFMDGLATVFALGGVYAAGTFAMGESRILYFGIALNIAAGTGAWVFSGVDDRIGSRRTILVTLAGLLLFSSLILVAPDEFWFWIFGILLGVFVGPVQASSRAYFSHVAPDHLRTQMFGLYALAAKATSFAGPLLVGLLTALTGSQRLGLIVIPGLFLIGWLVLKGVPSAEGQAELP